jgi:hypothetical protein
MKRGEYEQGGRFSKPPPSIPIERQDYRAAIRLLPEGSAVTKLRRVEWQMVVIREQKGKGEGENELPGSVPTC